MRCAPVAEVCRDGFEVEVRDPIFNGGAPAERDDNELIRGVKRNIACDVCCEVALRVLVCWKIEDADRIHVHSSTSTLRHTYCIQ